MYLRVPLFAIFAVMAAAMPGPEKLDKKDIIPRQTPAVSNR